MKKFISMISAMFVAVSIFGLTLPDGTNAEVKRIEKDGDRTVAAELAAPVNIRTIYGVIEIRGRIEFYPDGKISKCNLTRDVLMRKFSYDFKASSIKPIELHESGCIKSAYIMRDTRFSVSKKGYVDADGGTQVTFYDNNVLKSFYPAINTFVYINRDGKELRIEAQKHRQVEYYESGYAKSLTAAVTLAINTAYGKIKTAPGEGELIIYESGLFGCIPCGEMCELNLGDTKVMTAADSSVSFYPNGNIMGFTADSSEKSIILYGRTYENQTNLCMQFSFDETGNVSGTEKVSRFSLGRD
jgi:hypothetical protein